MMYLDGLPTTASTRVSVQASTAAMMAASWAHRRRGQGRNSALREETRPGADCVEGDLQLRYQGTVEAGDHGIDACASSVSSNPPRRSSRTAAPRRRRTDARPACAAGGNPRTPATKSECRQRGRHAQAGWLGGVVFDAHAWGLLEMKIVRKPRARSTLGLARSGKQGVAQVDRPVQVEDVVGKERCGMSSCSTHLLPGAGADRPSAHGARDQLPPIIVRMTWCPALSNADASCLGLCSRRKGDHVARPCPLP